MTEKEAPPIHASRWGEGKALLSCADVNCNWSEVVTDNGPEKIQEHQDWHREGMPE